MGKQIVCKLYRLGKDGDKFSKALPINPPMRTRVIVDDDYVKERNERYHINGQLYVVDEKATAERDKAKQPVNDELAVLRGIADEKGIKYAKNAGVKKLTELIEATEN